MYVQLQKYMDIMQGSEHTSLTQRVTTAGVTLFFSFFSLFFFLCPPSSAGACLRFLSWEGFIQRAHSSKVKSKFCVLTGSQFCFSILLQVHIRTIPLGIGLETASVIEGPTTAPAGPPANNVLFVWVFHVRTVRFLVGYREDDIDSNSSRDEALVGKWHAQNL